MKKIWLLILVCCLAFTLVACSSSDKQNTKDSSESEDQTSKIDVAKAQEVTVGEGENVVSVRIPEQATQVDTTALESNVSQVSFILDNGNQVVVMQSAGNVTLSKIDDKFDYDKKVDINGMSCRLRYSKNDETTANTYGVAEAYDEDSDTSYFVMIVTNATKADLLALMQIVSGK